MPQVAQDFTMAIQLRLEASVLEMPEADARKALDTEIAGACADLKKYAEAGFEFWRASGGELPTAQETYRQMGYEEDFIAQVFPGD